MKTRVDDLIVVEGKTDIDFLSSFLDADFYSVNGSAVSKNDINFLKNVKKQRNIIVLTDPDFPGMKIRNYLNSEIDGLKNAFVRKEVSIKHHKVGVAESTKDEVIYALKNFIINTKEIKNKNITETDLFELGLLGNDTSKSLRDKISEKYHLGYCNGKSFLKKLNMLNVTLEELKEAIKC